jgi:NAD(P)-dependent dehydrogenase (short-subunit alcohol dehydrogenase family)
VLVHSAGVSADQGLVRGYVDEQYRYGFGINVICAFNIAQSFAPMLDTTAHIYNISSGMAHIAPIYKDDWAYATQKAAVAKMFDYLQEQESKLARGPVAAGRDQNGAQ